MYLGYLLAFFKVVETLRSAGPGKYFGITKVPSQLVDSGQARTTGDGHNFGVISGRDWYAMGAPYVDFGAHSQIHQMVGKGTHINYRKLKWVI
jgi:hypothetical protein